MEPTIATCPSCSQKLAIPQGSEGQLVRCPACQTTFTAGGERPAEHEPEPSVSKYAHEEAFSREPEGYPSRARDDDYDRGYSRWRRRDREKARSYVVAPAIALIVLGSLQIVGGVGLCGLGFFGMVVEPPARGEDKAVASVLFAIAFLGLFWGSAIVYGAYKMMKLQSYGWAMAASIMSLASVIGCGIFGLGFGIWALVMLNMAGVREEFGRNE